MCVPRPSFPSFYLPSFAEQVFIPRSRFTQICLSAGEKWSGEEIGAGSDVLPSLLYGANVAGFIKVADAMKAQGDWW